MAVEFYDEQETLTQMHPALDMANDTLYVAVQAGIKGKGIQEIILTSKGEAFTQEEWQLECVKRGLLPYTTANLSGCGPRWSIKALRDVQGGDLAAPTWQETYNAIYREMDARLQMRDKSYLVVLALFAMMTYFHTLFDFLPILHLRGPAESGKSGAGAIIGHIAFNGTIGGRATASSLFRRAHEGRYTQIITEADHLAGLDSGEALVQQFQAGCSKAEAWVEVTEGGKGQPFQPVRYFIFNPRVLLSTKQFKSQPLRTRCIRLDIIKTPNTDETKLRRSKNDDRVWSPLRDMLYRLLLLNWQEVAATKDKLCEEWRGKDAPRGRTFEKWLPLATIASLVSSEVLAQVKTLARDSQAEQQEDAENTFEATLMRFAAWLVRDGDTVMTRGTLYDRLIDRGVYHYPEGKASPKWADEMGVPVSIDQLQQWIKTNRALVKELKRLNLIPQDPNHTREGDYYPLSKESILATVGEYLGSMPEPEPTEIPF